MKITWQDVRDNKELHYMLKWKQHDSRDWTGMSRCNFDFVATIENHMFNSMSEAATGKPCNHPVQSVEEFRLTLFRRDEDKELQDAITAYDKHINHIVPWCDRPRRHRRYGGGKRCRPRIDIDSFYCKAGGYYVQGNEDGTCHSGHCKKCNRSRWLIKPKEHDFESMPSDPKAIAK